MIELVFAGVGYRISQLLVSLPALLETTPAARIFCLLIEREVASESGDSQISTDLINSGLVEKLLEVVKDPASLEQGKSDIALPAFKTLS